MVESEAEQLSEEIMLGAVVFGHEQMQIAIAAINELVPRSASRSEMPEGAGERRADRRGVRPPAATRMRSAYKIADKMERYAADRRSCRGQRKRSCVVAMSRRSTKARSSGALDKLKKTIVRGQILAGEPRIDGRDTRTVRPITFAPACCRAPTARRCSRVAKPRRWS